MKIDKHKPLHWLLLLQQGLYTVIAIGLRYITPRPEKPVVVLYGHQLSGNLKALYEQWERTHRSQFEMYFLSLDPGYPPYLEAQGVNVLRCSSLRDMFNVGCCSAMITDHGLHAMQPLIYFTGIKFIDVWHGIPFKGFIPRDFRVQHQYDQVWVSSPLLKKIYVEKFGFPEEVVKPLGYARVDKLFRGDKPSSSYRALAGIPEDKKIVLYAPTWQQDDKGRELFPFGETHESFIDALNNTCREHGAELVIRSHLNARIEATAREGVYYAAMKDFPDTESLLIETDVLICDWSSISFDYLALNRPTIFLDVEPPFKNGFSLGKEYRFGLVAETLPELEESLANILECTENYFRQQGGKHADVTKAVYVGSDQANSSLNQLDQLVSIFQASHSR